MTDPTYFYVAIAEFNTNIKWFKVSYEQVNENNERVYPIISRELRYLEDCNFHGKIESFWIDENVKNLQDEDQLGLFEDYNDLKRYITKALYLDR